MGVTHRAAAAVTRVTGRSVDARPRERVAVGVYLYCTNSYVIKTINLHIYLEIGYPNLR